MTIARERATQPIPQRSPEPMRQRAPVERRPLNAQQVTQVALTFLKSLGHKRGINPVRVFLESQRYVVEAEIGKKLVAKVHVDMITSEIKEYNIETKPEESPEPLPVEPKTILMMVGVSVVVSVLLALLDLQSMLSGLF